MNEMSKKLWLEQQWFVLDVNEGVVVSEFFDTLEGATKQWKKLLKQHKGSELKVCETIYGWGKDKK